MSPGGVLHEVPTTEILGVRFHALTEQQTVAHVVGELAARRGGMVVTANLDHLRRCRSDPAYRELVAGADLVTADGMPVVWASRVAGTPLPGLVAGSNLISSLSRAAAGAGRSLYLLGGNAGAADGAAEVLRSRSPELRVAGTRCPNVGFEDDAAEMTALVAELERTAPDIVFVGLGSPKQERLILSLRDRLPRAWWIGVGISFSYLTGDVRRAPPWMRRAGLEWLHRLTSEPGRLARRYLFQGLPFAARLFAWAVARRMRLTSG